MAPISGLPTSSLRVWLEGFAANELAEKKSGFASRIGREVRGREKALNLQWPTWSGDGKEPLGGGGRGNRGSRATATREFPFSFLVLVEGDVGGVVNSL
jgi:hypothetical protein